MAARDSCDALTTVSDPLVPIAFDVEAEIALAALMPEEQAPLLDALHRLAAEPSVQASPLVREVPGSPGLYELSVGERLLVAFSTDPERIRVRNIVSRGQVDTFRRSLARDVRVAETDPGAAARGEAVEPWRAPAMTSRPPPHILRIGELSGIRLFEETPSVDIPFPLPEGERGQWIVLIGENGSGKTTLLRALALALASPSVASKLLDDRLPLTRNGEEGRISIELDTGVLSIAVRRGERTEVVEPTSTSHVERPWVVGYGVRRAHACGGNEVGPAGELHTLFDRPASLYNARQWLKDLDAGVLREQRHKGPDAPPGPREAVWKSVEHALRTLLGVTGVEVDEGGAVYVRHPTFGRVRIDALSDGYLTTAGWVIDLIARWVDRQQELDEPVGVDMLRRMSGFVLLDEIDLHLHPVWQHRILADVRTLFPRLSFVVTTHNPLTLQGARLGGVYVMRRDGARVELVWDRGEAG